MEERQRREMGERESERVETETIEVTEEKEETEDRGEKRPRNDTYTDPECRQKKGQMKSTFLSDSDEEAV